MITPEKRAELTAHCIKVCGEKGSKIIMYDLGLGENEYWQQHDYSIHKDWNTQVIFPNDVCIISPPIAYIDTIMSIKLLNLAPGRNTTKLYPRVHHKHQGRKCIFTGRSYQMDHKSKKNNFEAKLPKPQITFLDGEQETTYVKSVYLRLPVDKE